jgi:hypothetical protein
VSIEIALPTTLRKLLGFVKAGCLEGSKEVGLIEIHVPVSESACTHGAVHTSSRLR